MRKECETCIHLPICKDELKNNETELCPYYEIEKPEEDELSEQLKTLVSNVGSATKPPIGVMPEIFFKEQRLRDLAAGIYRYVSLGYFGGEYSTIVGIWCKELSRRLNKFR